jgi:hypothetical protein
MTEKKIPTADIDQDATDEERREALIKIGKYAAYTTPAMMVTISSARAGTPAPTMSPSPTPSPTETPAP